MNKKLILSLLSVLLLAAAPALSVAGLNPARPGLAPAVYAGKTLQNNAFSAMCVDCHSRVPVMGTHNGSHFVSKGPDATGADQTNSGGGWGTAGTNSQAGLRDNGQYFKVSAWSSGAASKYGDLATDNSYSTISVGNHTGVVDNTASNYANKEIICESCHNILVNAAGGNNLLSTIVAQTDDSTASICVGCHGDMYDDDTPSASSQGPTGANATVNGTKYANARNTNEVGGGKKGVNTIHVVEGKVYDMNHHVTTGDVVNAAIVAVGQTWRDTTVISADAILNPVSNSGTRGQMPQLATWQDGKTKPTTAVSCLNCHTHGHGGNAYTAASILRDTSALKTAAPANPTDRLSDAGRGFFDFNDTLYCNDCHTLK